MDALEKYVHDFSEPEEELLHELDRETNLRAVAPRMISGHIQGRLLEMLVRMLRPRRALEIGTFTGYSALSMAAGLEEEAELHTVGILIEPFPAAVLVFSINEGAYCAETIRAALESVPKGQMEAGQCVGMSYLQIIRRIILPQALRTAFPTLASTLIAMVKDTSLAANITVTEMFMTTQRIVARTYEPLALYIEVGLVYLLFCTVLTRLQAVGERYLNSKGAQRS